MRVCMLLAGHKDPRMDPALPSFCDLLIDLFEKCDPDHRIHMAEMPVIEGSFPEDPEAFDGYLITGSPFSVYDPHPWILRLLDFVRIIYDAKLPLAGICFGHQAIAQALGGEVAGSSKGWGVGIRRSSLLDSTSWMDSAATSCDLIYSHRDQVTALPDGARLLMGDDFCPYASFSMNDTVFALQGHPEFTREVALELIHLRADAIGHLRADKAIKSLDLPHHGDRVGKWLVDFFLHGSASL